MGGQRDPILSRRLLAISRRTLTIYAKIVSKQLVKGNIFIYRTRMGDRGPGSRSPGDPSVRPQDSNLWNIKVYF